MRLTTQQRPPQPAAALALLLTTLLSSALAQSPKCYYPNGKEAVDYTYVACNSSSPTGFSSCCVPSEGDICTDAGLCEWPEHYTYRGACTDKSWKDGSCPQNVCQGVKSDTYAPLVKCAYDSGWCCSAPNTDCCTDGSELFQVTPLALTAPSPSASASASGSPDGDEPPPPNDKAKDEPPSSVRTATLGAAAGAVGAVLVIGIAGGLAFFCIRKKKRAKKMGGAIPLADHPEVPPDAPHDLFKPPGSSASELPAQTAQWGGGPGGGGGAAAAYGGGQGFPAQQQGFVAPGQPMSPPPAYQSPPGPGHVQPVGTVAAAAAAVGMGMGMGAGKEGGGGYGYGIYEAPGNQGPPAPPGHHGHQEHQGPPGQQGPPRPPGYQGSPIPHGAAELVSPISSAPTPAPVSPNGDWYGPPMGNVAESDSRPVDPRVAGGNSRPGVFEMQG